MTRLLIIIPAEIVDAVRTASAAVFGDVAHAEFVQAASPTGDQPATHHWLSGVFPPEEMALLQPLQAAFPDAQVEPYDIDTQPNRPWEKLAEMGLQRLTSALP